MFKALKRKFRKMPKQWILIAFYMVVVYILIMGLMKYAKYHPIVDV